MSDTTTHWIGTTNKGERIWPPLSDEERAARLAKLAKEREEIGNPARRAFGVFGSREAS